MSLCVEARGVWKEYRAATALAGVSLSLCGGLNVVVGPNGSGKTTLLRLIAGLARPSRGRVVVGGVDPWRRRGELLSGPVRVGFESMGLPWWMRGLDLLRHYAAEKGVGVEDLASIAERLGLPASALRRSVRSYSMGMRKKLLLAMALAPGAGLYVLDEPYTLLDAAAVRALDSILRERAAGATVVVASHVVTPALEEAERLIGLSRGRLAVYEERGTPSRTYRCTGRGVAARLAEEGGYRRLVAEGDRVLVEYPEPRPPPAPGCRPVLPVATVMEELVAR